LTYSLLIIRVNIFENLRKGVPWILRGRRGAVTYSDTDVLSTCELLKWRRTSSRTPQVRMFITKRVGDVIGSLNASRGASRKSPLRIIY